MFDYAAAVDVYVETTVWSFALSDDAPDYRADTLRFLGRCRSPASGIVPVISAIVIEEIRRASEPKRSALLELIHAVAPALVPVSGVAEALAGAFVAGRAVPPSKPDDARHVAVAFAERIPVLISWNFKHIASLRRADRFNAIAVLEGFANPVRICSPAELQYDE